MKILMCNKFNFIHGGAERYLFDLSRGLKSVGCEVSFFSAKDPRNVKSEYDKFFVDGSNYKEIAKSNLFVKARASFDFIYSLRAQERLRALMKEYKPDIAHVHNIYHQISPSILHVFREKRIPVVMTLHDYKVICPNYKLFVQGQICERCLGGQYYQCFLKKCFNGSWHASLLGMLEAYVHVLLKSYDGIDLFIAPSRFMFEKFQEFGMPREKILLLPYALCLDEFSPDFSSGQYVLFIGRLVPGKGVSTLLRSLKHLSNVCVKIVGEGPLRTELERVTRQEGLSQVEFMGYQSSVSLNRIIRDAYCLVMPSEWHEPMGLVIYEAFASGKGVIASGRGGISDLVENGVNGVIFEAGNSHDLAEKIKYALEHPDEVRRWGENGYARIRRCNDLKAHSMRMRQVYQNLLLPQGGGA